MLLEQPLELRITKIAHVLRELPDERAPTLVVVGARAREEDAFRAARLLPHGHEAKAIRLAHVEVHVTVARKSTEKGFSATSVPSSYAMAAMLRGTGRKKCKKK